MASGLGQDDAKLVFESSEAVKVVSTFDELNLKEDLLRGIYAYSPFNLILGLVALPPAHCRNTFLVLRLREALRNPAASYPPYHQRPRCDRPGPIRNW